MITIISKVAYFVAKSGLEAQLGDELQALLNATLAMAYGLNANWGAFRKRNSKYVKPR